MSLPGGKAIYLIAFSLPLSYIRKLTDQPATRITYVFFAYMFWLLILFCIFAPWLETRRSFNI